MALIAAWRQRKFQISDFQFSIFNSLVSLNCGILDKRFLVEPCRHAKRNGWGVCQVGWYAGPQDYRVFRETFLAARQTPADKTLDSPGGV
ncbi:MAG: hypothetical protein HY736_13850 [Verrucomicrobia bacterium]|nr:hypothetical protein [Verrucomicrobiota bacterium]